jgi:hypothetical protein
MSPSLQDLEGVCAGQNRPEIGDLRPVLLRLKKSGDEYPHVLLRRRDGGPGIVTT